MPYRIEKREGSKPWKIVKRTTGEVVGSSITKANAVDAIKARYANEFTAKEISEFSQQFGITEIQAFSIIQSQDFGDFIEDGIVRVSAGREIAIKV